MKRGLFAHSWHFVAYPQERIDALVADALRMHCTDLFVAVNCWTDGPDMLIGDSEFMASRPERIDGNSMMEYVIEQAHAAGLRVHAVFVVGLAAAWSELMTGLPAEWTVACGDAAWIRLESPEVQRVIVDTLGDFADRHPTLDGLGLDYFRSRADCPPDMSDVDLTDILDDLRWRVDCDVIPFCGFLEWNSTPEAPTPVNHQDPNLWLEVGLVDCVAVMGWSIPLAMELEWPASFPGPVLMGSIREDSDFVETVQARTDRGEDHWLFAWPQIPQEQMDAIAGIPLEDDDMDVIDHLLAAEEMLRAAGLDTEADQVAALIVSLRARDDELDALADVIEED